MPKSTTANGLIPSTPMSTVDYLTKVNMIVHSVTGMVLVPSDQIVETPYSQRFEPSADLLSSNNPYCLLYNTGVDACEGCPMALAGNICIPSDISDNTVGTYTECLGLWKDMVSYRESYELLELGKAYKESNS